MSHYGNRRLEEIKSHIQSMAMVFGQKNNERVLAYAQKIIETDPGIVKIACRSITECEDYFPSLARLLEYIRVEEERRFINSGEKSKYEKDYELEFEKEEKELREIEKFFNINFGEKHLIPYVKFWILGVYGNIFHQLQASNQDFMIFKEPALFDLADAKFNKEKAVELGKRKISKLNNLKKSLNYKSGKRIYC